MVLLGALSGRNLQAYIAAGISSDHIIGVIPEQIVTRNLVEEVTTLNGSVAAAPERDILKIAVVERHKATGHVGVGLVKGFGLREGALASSVAHDSHNVVVVGATDAEMLRAAQTVLELGGGICAVRGEHLLGRFPLPVAGLMSAGRWRMPENPSPVCWKQHESSVALSPILIWLWPSSRFPLSHS